MSPEMQIMVTMIGTIVGPIVSVLWGMHRAAKAGRAEVMSRLGHMHDCMHRLELRIVAIETRGHQRRATDFKGEPGERV